MINGIYSGASALDNYSKQQEVISANLAHLNTPGYRRQLVSFQEMQQAGDGNMKSGANIRSIEVDFQPGANKVTGRPLDLALQGEGFFVFESGDAEIYTRNGVLFRTPEGQLVNQDGMRLKGVNGEPVTVPNDVSDRDLAIDSSGRLFANGSEIDTLSIAEFDDPHLLDPNGQVYFSIGDATKTAGTNTNILQGSRELSNAQPVTELVGLIVGSRNFESAQKAIRTISDAIQANLRS